MDGLMNSQIDTPDLRVISALLGQEICRPLDALQAGLIRMLDDPDQPPSSTDRAHAATMLELCEDLRRLTQDCLGGDLRIENTNTCGSPAPPRLATA